MAERSQIPDELITRLQKQRRRQRIVRLSFAVTAVLTVVLLFGINHAQTLAPTSRNLYVVPRGGVFWMVDQHHEFSQQGVVGGSFGILRVDGNDVVEGTRYDGVAQGISFPDESTLAITSGARLLEFDLSQEGWPRKRVVNLGIRDPGAAATVIHCAGAYWLCWTSGNLVMVRPLDDRSVEPHSLHRISSAGAAIGGVAVGDRIWLAVRDTRKDVLSLIAFRPSIAEVSVVSEDTQQPVNTDAAETPAVRRTTLHILQRTTVVENVRRASVAVLPGEEKDRPFVAYTLIDEKDWKLTYQDPATGEWEEGRLPERDKPPSGMDLSNFTSIARDGEQLVAVYNDGRDVKMAHGTRGENGVQWQSPQVLPVDRTQGTGAYLFWLIALAGVLMVMASQGVWLLLNRERPSDRTLVAMLEKKIRQDTDEPKAKPEPKLLYASGLARAVALFLDVAITSPIIILLQDVYEYSLDQAYGFLAFGTASRMDVAVFETVMATLVTLLVLVIYGAVTELFWGKTFGKALLRLRVVDRKGEQPATWRIIVRNALKIVEMIHFLVLLVPMILMMMTGKQQRLGDLAAGTYVIVDALPEESPDDIDV